MALRWVRVDQNAVGVFDGQTFLRHEIRLCRRRGRLGAHLRLFNGKGLCSIARFDPSDVRSAARHMEKVLHQIIPYGDAVLDHFQESAVLQ